MVYGMTGTVKYHKTHMWGGKRYVQVRLDEEGLASLRKNQCRMDLGVLGSITFEPLPPSSRRGSRDVNPSDAATVVAAASAGGAEEEDGEVGGAVTNAGAASHATAGTALNPSGVAGEPAGRLISPLGAAAGDGSEPSQAGPSHHPQGGGDNAIDTSVPPTLPPPLKPTDQQGQQPTAVQPAQHRRVAELAAAAAGDNARPIQEQQRLGNFIPGGPMDPKFALPPPPPAGDSG